ncbi:MAG: caspase domain-containing protein [Parvibaculaceae bacterium]
MRILLALIAFLLCGWSEVAPAHAETRVALVIGNSAYRHVPTLATPTNDARDMAAKLERMGFKVVLGSDLDFHQLRATVEEFIGQLDGADLALFYYAGHGLQVDGVNYIIPVDASLRSLDRLEFEALSVYWVLSEMKREAKVSLVFLDACRDNPLADNLARKKIGWKARTGLVGRGLAPNDVGLDSLIALAQTPNVVARDESGRNSAFASALLKYLGTSEQNVELDLRQVRLAVEKATDGAQLPWYSSSLTDNLILVPKPDSALKDAAYRAASVVYEANNGEMRPTYEDGSYALLVGVSDYDDDKKAWEDLPAVKSELKELAQVLKSMHGFEVTELYDPTGNELRQAIELFVNEHGQKRNARLLIMLSGHGETATLNNKKLAWFVPRDAPRLADGRGPFNTVALSMRRIEEWSETMEAKHVLWLFDSCFAGAALRMTGKRSSGDQAYSEFLHANAVRRVITAGSENEAVPAESRFAHRLIAVLKGEIKVGDGDQLVTGDEIGQFLRQDLISFTRRQGLKPQTPQNDTIVLEGEEGDIVFKIEPSLIAASGAH